MSLLQNIRFIILLFKLQLFNWGINGLIWYIQPWWCLLNYARKIALISLLYMQRIKVIVIFLA